MMQPNPQFQAKRPVKAVGMISGGLDSTVAAKVIKDLGIEVQGVYFAMPWGCCDKGRAQEAADKIGINFIVLQLDERYLEMVRNPQHGYGTALNPCVDCRIHMFARAAQYMKAIEADFVFTGEVLGQRPMSQKRHSMKWIEKGAGLEGRLLRPLCAQLLDPTIPEQEGLVDREKLLRLNGRGRKEQIRIAAELGIKDYPNPAGGCLLTDQNFARRMKDTFKHGYRNFRETVALKWGRHFRLNENFKIILGRDEEENNALKSFAHEKDIIMELPTKDGPTLILKGDNPDQSVLAEAAALIKQYSKYRNHKSVDVDYWPARNPKEKNCISSSHLDEQAIEQIYI